MCECGVLCFITICLYEIGFNIENKYVLVTAKLKNKIELTTNR